MIPNNVPSDLLPEEAPEVTKRLEGTKFRQGDMQDNSISTFFNSVDNSVSILFDGFLQRYSRELNSVQSSNPDLSNRLERNVLYKAQQRDDLLPEGSSFETTFDRPRLSIASSLSKSSIFEQPADSSDQEEIGFELKSLPLKSLYNRHSTD
jgi:hypothetical protein